jgi:cellulose synthase/poly-beta-1,6-N-acetylglucosamine synthase-like glycosyltransferase
MIFLISFTLLLLFLYVLLFLYYRYGWSLISESKSNPTQTPQTHVSVVIPFRNEAQNLPNLLRCLSNQSYPNHLLEFILVNDHSDDDGPDLVAQSNIKNIHLISLADSISASHSQAYKKLAIEAAIQKSNGDLIITTDADCTMGPHWVSSIVEHYEQANAAFMVMPVLLKSDKTICSAFQSIDFMTMQGITAASAALHFHHMCNGANLAYPRSVFYEVNGFSGIDHIASGDDLLLMNKIANFYPDRISYVKNKEAIVSTLPAPNWTAFFQQRIRWASKAKHYQDKKMLPVLFVVYLFNVLLFSLCVFSLISIFSPLTSPENRLCLYALTIFSFGIKIIAELIFLIPVSLFYGKRNQLFIFPFLQPLHVFYMVVAGWLGKFGSYTWKGRKLK